MVMLAVAATKTTKHSNSAVIARVHPVHLTNIAWATCGCRLLEQANQSYSTTLTIAIYQLVAWCSW